MKDALIVAFLMLLNGGVETATSAINVRTVVAYFDYITLNVPPDYRSTEPLKDLSVLLSAKQLFRITVYRRVIGSGYWKKVGKLPLREDLLPVQMQYVYHKYDNIKFDIYNPATGIMTPATKEECRGLEEAAVWDYGAISERIRDHYNGIPCIWLKEEYELFKD